MSLFTTPLTINDGTADRIFDWQYQEPGSALVGRYYEPAASASAESMVRVAHTESKSGIKRHLIQRSEECSLVDPSDDEPAAAPITVNITVNHNPKHADADIEKQVLLAKAMLSIAGITASVTAGNI